MARIAEKSSYSQVRETRHCWGGTRHLSVGNAWSSAVYVLTLPTLRVSVVMWSWCPLL